MARLLMIAAVVLVIYLLVRSFRRNAISGKGSQSVEDMVRCAHCGVHIPKSESILSGDQFYCSIEHRNVYRK